MCLDRLSKPVQGGTSPECGQERSASTSPASNKGGECIGFGIGNPTRPPFVEKVWVAGEAVVTFHELRPLQTLQICGVIGIYRYGPEAFVDFAMMVESAGQSEDRSY